MADHVIHAGLDAYTRETIAVSTTAKNLTATKLRTQIGSSYQNTGAVAALLTVETNSIRYTLDGTTATASVGHVLAAGDTLLVTGMGNLSRLSMIRVSADASVEVTYFT